VGRDEVRNHKLSTLAAHFGTDVAPDHRALSDARATGELLHHLFERFGGYGVTTLEELSTVRQSGWAKRQAKSHFAKGVPPEPDDSSPSANRPIWPGACEGTSTLRRAAAGWPR